jgi:hypothetical protein
MRNTPRVSASRRLALAGAMVLVLVGVVAGCSDPADEPGGAGDGSTQGPPAPTSSDDPSGAGDPDPSGSASGDDGSGTDPATQDPAGSGDGTADPGDDAEDVQNPEGAFVEDPEAYADEPQPPASELAVLCNLSPTYLTALAELAADDAGGSIAMAVVALDDDIRVWAPLVGFHPEMRADLDRANRVLDLWYEAMHYQDSGDTVSAASSLESADAEIAQVSGPSADLSTELGC